MTEPTPDLSRSPYARVLKARDEGRGVRLTFEECCELMHDDAFATRAQLDADGLDDVQDYDV